MRISEVFNLQKTQPELDFVDIDIGRDTPLFIDPFFLSSSFSGYKTLAYCYVSWAIAIPEILSQLQMPFDREYELAKQIVE